MKKHHVSIWFLVGLHFSIYGILIASAGIYAYFHPPESPTVGESLHPAIWWGGIMLALGIFYTCKYRPQRADRG